MAPGIYVRRGLDEDASAANDNGIANVAVVIGGDAVAVMDPGGSRHDGELLRAAIGRLTSLPIRYILLSHVHPDHVLGACAFAQDSAQIVAHARLPRALALRGEYYRARLAALLGTERAGEIVQPTLLVEDHHWLELGARKLLITAHGLAHSDCDISAFDDSTRTLLAGDLLFVDRVPSLDGSLKGWLRELAALRVNGAARAVPGHGPAVVDWPAGAADIERYLGTLLRETRAAFASGTSINSAIHSVGQGERERWKLFDDYHAHNVTQAYKEVEWE